MKKKFLIFADLFSFNKNEFKYKLLVDSNNKLLNCMFLK